MKFETKCSWVNKQHVDRLKHLSFKWLSLNSKHPHQCAIKLFIEGSWLRKCKSAWIGLDQTGWFLIFASQTNYIQQIDSIMQIKHTSDQLILCGIFLVNLTWFCLRFKSQSLLLNTSTFSYSFSFSFSFLSILVQKYNRKPVSPALKN